MKAILLDELALLTEQPEPLWLADVPVPIPHPGESRLKVLACGVCHTELDEIENRKPPPRLPVILGHEVIGQVDQCGTGASKYRPGDRVGVGWIHHSSGGPEENISLAFVATGRDVNGGYAEYRTVPEDYAYPITKAYTDAQAAPLLCAGGVGFRALKHAGIRDGAIY